MPSSSEVGGSFLRRLPHPMPRMRARRAALGIVFLVLAAFVAAEAFGPYLSLAEATSSFALPVSLAAIAITAAGAGIVLLSSAWWSDAEERNALASKVEDPHHPAPIRSPVLPVTSGGNAYAGVAGGVTVPKGEDDERDPD